MGDWGEREEAGDVWTAMRIVLSPAAAPGNFPGLPGVWRVSLRADVECSPHPQCGRERLRRLGMGVICGTTAYVGAGKGCDTTGETCVSSS